MSWEFFGDFHLFILWGRTIVIIVKSSHHELRWNTWGWITFHLMTPYNAYNSCQLPTPHCYLLLVLTTTKTIEPTSNKCLHKLACTYNSTVVTLTLFYETLHRTCLRSAANQREIECMFLTVSFWTSVTNSEDPVAAMQQPNSGFIPVAVLKQQLIACS